MGITAGLVMIALGAILKFALPWSWLGVVNIAAVGVILMIVGAVGLVVALIIWGPRCWPGRGADPDVVEERYIHERRPPI